MIPLLALLLASPTLVEWKGWQCEGKSVTGRYVNYAQGFSVRMPKGLRGRHGGDSGPERGVSLPLAADRSAVLVVYGEPNSAEWGGPEDAVAQADEYAKADGGIRERPYETKFGSLSARGITCRSSGGGDVEDVVVAFRPGGGLVYTAHLATTAERYGTDRRPFEGVLRSFRLEEWR